MYAANYVTVILVEIAGNFINVEILGIGGEDTKQAMMTDPELLELNVYCNKCMKLPIDCDCDDRNFRLNNFAARLCHARFNVVAGGASTEQRKLTNKFGLC